MYLENPKKKLYLYETMHQALNILLSNKTVEPPMDLLKLSFKTNSKKLLKGIKLITIIHN